MHHGQSTNGATVMSFATQVLSQAARSALPIVTAAHRAPDTFGQLDGLSDLFLSNPVANRASRAQGRGLLTAARQSFRDEREESLTSIEHAEQAHHLCFHHAPVFGAVFAALKIELIDTQRAFLFITVRSVAAAGVRLGLVGGFDAQQLQAVLAPEIDATIGRCGALLPTDIAQTAPLIDLCQSTHDRLYSRLFQS